MPTACAAAPSRVRSSVASATDIPRSTSPSTFSAGTRTSVNAGDPVGFTVEVKNTGDDPATGASLNDPLPAGSGSGVLWAVDNSTGTPANFVLSGAKGSQTLGLASNTIPINADYTIHITASTSATECGKYDIISGFRSVHPVADDLLRP